MIPKVIIFTAILIALISADTTPSIIDDGNASPKGSPRQTRFRRKQSINSLINVDDPSSLKRIWSNSNSERTYTASWTPYKNVEPEKVKEIKYAGFKKKKTYCLFRHGIRAPGDETIEGMKTRLPQIQQLVLQRQKKTIETIPCYSEDLKRWTVYWELRRNTATVKSLVNAGREEMFNLGERFRIEQASILPEKFDQSIIKVKFTDSYRTEESARYFIEGLFGEVPEGDLWYERVDPKDKILKPDSSCPRWKEWIKKSKIADNQKRRYLKGAEMKKTVADIRNRCRFQDKELKKKDVYLMFETCCFELAWKNYSPWCHFFTTQHMKVLDFKEDIEFHINDGYGSKFNARILCVLFKDMLEFLTGTQKQIIAINFTHLTALLKFMAHLGLYEDDFMLTPYSLNDEDIEIRIWRSSVIGTFSTNLCFDLYENEKTHEEALRLTHQENPINIPGCPMDTDLCPLEKIRDIFHDSIKHCYYNKWCGITEEDENEKKQKKKEKLKTAMENSPQIENVAAAKEISDSDSFVVT